jgi:ABC-type multidrug transport system ATPase subunit
MTALNDIARSGRTIILSIHQPRSDIYVDKLDNIVLLVKGGQVAYAGPRTEVAPTLASAGYPIPPLYNPADWLLDLASVDLRGDRETATRERVAKLVENWANTHREKNEMDVKDREQDLVEIGSQEDRFTPMWIALPLIVERMTKNL